MQSYTGHITQSEWRWVLLISVTLVSVAFLPLLLLLVLSTTSAADWQFMGALHQHRDAAAFLSRTQQGLDGAWLVHFQHTPEPHNSALVQPIYPLLGHLARLMNVSAVLIYHIARVGAAFFMYVALYQLGASIWVRVRTRRVFFMFATVASGLGWLHALLTDSVRAPDLLYAHAFPFLGTLVGVHYPLTIALLALLIAVLISIFRPGATAYPSVDNGGLIALLTSLGLAFLYPEALVPLTAAAIACMLINGYVQRGVNVRELYWMLWVLVPPLPLLTYYLITFEQNPVFRGWLEQRADWSLSADALVFGLGIPLLVALPGLIRAFRRFEPDGDRLVLLWLLAMIVGLVLPLPVRQHFLVGLMLPVAYFAGRSMEDLWFRRVRRRMRRRLFVLGVPILAISQLLVLAVPLLPAAGGYIADTGSVLPPGYLAAFNWLEQRMRSEDVILASPQASAWAPLWTGGRVVYGHPAETMDAAEHRWVIDNWYRSDDAQQCLPLLSGGREGRNPYIVRYVLHGPLEQKLGGTVCTSQLRFVASFGQVRIYSR